jgi:hypothetical protein
MRPLDVLALITGLFRLWGGRIDQMVVDVTNAWRNKLGRVILETLLSGERGKGGEVLLSGAEVEEFVDEAVELLWVRAQPLVDLLKILRPTHRRICCSLWTRKRR